MHKNPPPGSGSTIQRETTDNLHIKSYAPHYFRLNDETEWENTAILLQNKEVITDPQIIPSTFEELTEAHFEAWAERKPTVILIGTGNQMQFLEPKWRAYFYQRGIGIETMATESLCRTFAILATEDRNALGIFFPIKA
ncbi:MTH938/NDUFAF3 family protein [Ignatzschineria rhizosphaerae]|uniref:MTH938/NDUFAF3 family protein n=1 Tax=Ignatzschineria rhizosphaerae TaxID=2923279 RepID=A0ABY3X1D6_9GAMM|nr:MTH938/NDUFAF3 family protein [Ignatzschineria rhizosphaerae]UNM96644.1 MTH938/NDUFAF3 family protein [Ignatzschineria rhizosphaerae]